MIRDDRRPDDVTPDQWLETLAALGALGVRDEDHIPAALGVLALARSGALSNDAHLLETVRHLRGGLAPERRPSLENGGLLGLCDRGGFPGWRCTRRWNHVGPCALLPKRWNVAGWVRYLFAGAR